MELALAMPMPAAMPAAKNGINTSNKKTAGLPFGDILGATLNADPTAQPLTKDDTSVELPGQPSSENMLSAFMAFFQPPAALTGLTTAESAQPEIQTVVSAVTPAIQQIPCISLQAAPGIPQSVKPLPGPIAFQVSLPVNSTNQQGAATQTASAQQSVAAVADNRAAVRNPQEPILPFTPATDMAKPAQLNATNETEANRISIPANAVRSIAEAVSAVSPQAPRAAGSSPMKADTSSNPNEKAVLPAKPNELAMPHGTEKQTSGFEMSEERQSDPKQAVKVAVLPSNDTHTVPHISFEAIVQGTGPLQKTTGASTEQASVPVQDPYGISSQIIEYAKLISRPQNTEMIIKLKPEHLGELTFRITVEQGAVSATFHSNNPEVRSIIENGLPQLKQELSSQGLKVDTVGVFTALAQFSQQDPRGSQQQYQQADIPLSRRQNSDFSEVTEETMQAPIVSNSQIGVDYRV